MKVLIVSPEIYPFAKTGGLADVVGALPRELAQAGHDVRLAMPKYGIIDDDGFHLLPILHDIQVHLGSRIHTAEIRRAPLPGSSVPVYFVNNTTLFQRPGLYTENGKDYPDNAERFAFFCKAVIWLLKGLDWIPDIIHCNDWQTALIPVYLRSEPDMIKDAELSRIPVLFTIHNLAYQGLFPGADAERIGVGPSLFHPAALEYYGDLNFMKGGLLFADYLSTVSPRYAREIQTKDFGCGLEGVLAQRSSQLCGILNGIDYNIWNPETDPHIAKNYSHNQLQGKAACKAALQQELGLHQQPDTPLLAIISRLDSQKGFDILEQALPDLLARNIQLVVLGTGAPEYHRMFEKVAAAHPGMVAARLTFDGPLSHRIEAGADIFLMPSRYEPCGLNQMYSLRYGTVPVVRETGGLADTVTDSNAETVRSGEGTGFVLKPYDADALTETVLRALDAYGKKAYWTQIVSNGMSRDLSWKASSRQYEELYQRMSAGD